jgi:hypothetical protein
MVQISFDSDRRIYAGEQRTNRVPRIGNPFKVSRIWNSRGLSVDYLAKIFVSAAIIAFQNADRYPSLLCPCGAVHLRARNVRRATLTLAPGLMTSERVT